jgi:hypothetical protein
MNEQIWRLVPSSSGDGHPASEASGVSSSEAPSRDPGRSRTGRSGAVVDVIVKLERLHKSELAPRVRIALLRSLAPRVLQVVGALSRAVALPRHQAPDAERRPTLAQRADGLMESNLKLALTTLDRSGQAFEPGAAADRQWLVRQLFTFLGRQIEDSVRSDRPWVPGVWQELHDLYLYLTRRPDVGLDEGQAPADASFDPETEYKRLLLLGLIKSALAPGQPSDRVFHALTVWARGSWIRQPGACDGAFGVYVVEISRDAPPKECVGLIDVGVNGWVLEPAHAFKDYVAGLAGPIDGRSIPD